MQYLDFWLQERGQGHYKLICKIINILSNEPPKQYIANYITDILLKFTKFNQDGTFSMQEYLDTIFIHNVDKWGFVTTYFPILHIYYVNYKVLDKENMDAFITLKELFNYTYKTSSEKLEVESIVNYLNRIGLLLEKAYKKLDKGYGNGNGNGNGNNVTSKKTTTKIKFTSTPKGITGKTIYNYNKQYTRKTNTRKQKIIQ
jgi:hypothetical protein